MRRDNTACYNMAHVNGNKEQTLYELTPRSRVLLEKPVLAQILLKKFRHFQKQNLHYQVHERFPLVANLAR
jgi:hypothetical protein